MSSYHSHIKIQKIDHTNADLMKTVLNIREQVFVREQNVDPELEKDAFEKSSVHYLVFYFNKPVGAARWRETQAGIKLERFAVLKKYRNKSIGTFILEQVLNDILPLKKRIYLHAQFAAVPFYLKHGFIKEGEMFTEAEIRHYKMYLPGT